MLDGFLDEDSDFMMAPVIEQIGWGIEHILSGIDILFDNAYSNLIDEDFIQDFITSFQAELGSRLKGACDADMVSIDFNEMDNFFMIHP